MLLEAAALLAILSPGPPGGPLDSRSIAGNGTASVLIDRAPSLGISFADPSADQEPALSADQKALNQASPGSWLDSQIQVPDDSIAEPPRALRDYLETHADALWAVVAALERHPPEWVEPKDETVFRYPYLLPSIRLQKLLLALALLEARNGHPIDADRALEASWSLSRPLEERMALIHQLAAVASRQWQAGVLRKMSEPGLSWLSRLDVDDAWQRMLEAYAAESDLSNRGMDSLASSDPWTDVARRAPRSIAAGLSKLSPCEGSALEEGEIWKFAERDLSVGASEEVAAVRTAFREMSLPNVVHGFRRAARVSVDRELTLQILRLRLEKQHEPDGRWPHELLNANSTVCPGATYVYRSDAAGMEVRFDGSIVEPNKGSVLPLSFSSRYPAKGPDSPASPVSTPPPTALTPTPGGGMIPPS